MTDEEVAADCRTRVEALFGASRNAIGSEINWGFEYTHHGEFAYCAYMIIANGYRVGEGDTTPEIDNLEAAAARTVDVVRENFPDAINQMLVWRKAPIVEQVKSFERMESKPRLYMRLGVVPLHGVETVERSNP